MKKMFALLLVIGVLTSFSGCKNTEISNDDVGENGVSIEDINEDEQDIDSESNDNTDNSDVTVEESTKEDLLKSAYEGKIDGVEFGIGDIGTDIIEKWGEPDETDYFLGGFYLKYGEIIFLTNGYDETGEVVIILFSDENTDVFGVKLGMTIKEIEKILGTPDEIRSLEDNEVSELYMENWSTSYNLGNHELTFVHKDKDGSTEWLSLRLR